MTNSNVASTKSTAKIVHEPSLLRIWWMNKNLRCDIAVNCFVIFLNIAAILYMIIHKIPLIEDVASLIFFTLFYFLFGLMSCILWLSGITEPSECEFAYIMGRISHNLGLVIFLHFLYCISPRLALFAGLHFILPYWLWYVVDIFGQSLCNGMQALRDWWKFVNQRETVVIESN